MESEIDIEKEPSFISREIFFPSFSSFIIFLFFSITIIILLEIFSGWFLSLFIPSIFIIVLIFIAVHLFIFRLIIFTSAFPGKNSLVQFYLSQSQGKYYAKQFLYIIIEFQLHMNSLVSKEIINLKTSPEDINSIASNLKEIQLVYQYYEGMKEKYREIGSYCEAFYIQIKAVNDHINDTKLDAISHLKNLMSLENSIELNQVDKDKIVKINTEVNKLIFLLKELLFENDFSCNILNHFRNYFYNDIFWSKEYIRMKTLFKVNYEDFFINSKDNNKIDCVLLKGNDSKANEKNNIIVICGPNLMPFEHMIYSWDLDQLYLSRFTDVLFWNYQGYGFSEGSATFENVRSDIETIYDYLKGSNRWNKIGVHGISVGGVSACHIAHARPIDLLIADRTFGSVERITLSLPCGKVLLYLSKLLCIPQVPNDENYMNAKCKKILLSDPNDMTISERISLKSSIAQKLIEKIHYNFLNSEHSPYSLSSRTNDTNMTNNIIDYALVPNGQETFYKSLLDIYTFMKNYLNNDPKAYDLKKKPVPNNPDALNSIVNDQTGNSFADLFYNRIKFHMLGIDSTGENISAMLDTENPKEFIRLFFNNLVVWGSHASQELSLGNLCLCSNLHVETSINQFIKGLEEILFQEEFQKYKQYELFDTLGNFVECLKAIELYIKNIHLENHHSVLNEFKGDLITLSCGHNAFFEDNEFDTFQHLLSKGFYSF